MTPTKKYLSDIIKSKKVVDNSDPANPKDFYEIVIQFTDARKVWLTVSTPDVKNPINSTHLQIVVKDNTSNKMIILLGDHNIPAGSLFPVFGGALVNNKTLIFRAADEISIIYEAKLDD